MKLVSQLSTLTSSLGGLITHLRNKYLYKATVNTLDQVFARYLSNSVGWGLLAYSLLRTDEVHFLPNIVVPT